MVKDCAYQCHQCLLALMNSMNELFTIKGIKGSYVMGLWDLMQYRLVNG